MSKDTTPQKPIPSPLSKERCLVLETCSMTLVSLNRATENDPSENVRSFQLVKHPDISVPTCSRYYAATLDTISQPLDILPSQSHFTVDEGQPGHISLLYLFNAEHKARNHKVPF